MSRAGPNQSSRESIHPAKFAKLRGCDSASDCHGGLYLPRCVAPTVLLELLDHTFQIGIASAKAPCEPVSAAFRDPCTVSDHRELTDLARRKDGVNIEALFDEGHETRDLGLVVLSRRAVNDLDLHLFPNPLR